MVIPFWGWPACTVHVHCTHLYILLEKGSRTYWVHLVTAEEIKGAGVDPLSVILRKKLIQNLSKLINFSSYGNAIKHIIRFILTKSSFNYNYYYYVHYYYFMVINKNVKY